MRHERILLGKINWKIMEDDDISECRHTQKKFYGKETNQTYQNDTIQDIWG